ncbi:MAG: hypothetical protein QM495_06640 [Lutibacter sp.]|uniref:hypothetical protein n=1 Tax=Lutibacter sp. TaxID=1925666 RepID=UPI003858D193
MKTYRHKIVTLTLLFLTIISVKAQKFDKTIKEKFKVNSDVAIVINATNTDVDIETWNKNEVSIEAVMEVEGVTKAAAEKILKKWKFEALGNKSKVKITSLSTNFDFKFDFDFNFPDIDVPHFEIPDIDFPDFEMPEMPEMDFDEFDYDAYKKDSSYLKGYKIRVAKQVKKFKESGYKERLDLVRNSDEYKLKIIEFKNSKEFKNIMIESKKIAEKVRKEILKNKSELKEQIKGAKKASKMAMEMIKKMKEEGKFDSIHNYSNSIHKLSDSINIQGENIYYSSDNKNSKVKVRKYFKIKVPKNATFDLNVRHGKLNIPNSNKKLSVNITYGNFVGGIISGVKNELKFSNSPVIINTLNSGNVTLKNVPNATFGTFSNANLFSNSSDVVIDEVGDNVALSQRFGNLEVLKIVPDFNNLNIILDYAKGTFKLSDAAFTFQINGKDSSFFIEDFFNKTTNIKKRGVETIQGFLKDKFSQNKLVLTGVYSSVNLN